MLQTNLASRPFYNERGVQFALVLAAAVVVGLTAFNAVTLVRLSATQSRLGAHAAQSEREAERLVAEAARIRTRIDPKELQTVSTAAREANGIIDRRAFSWTELFTRFEATLPPDVRIKAVQPHLDKGVFTVAIIAQARRIEDLEGFMDALERTGAFRDVTPTEETRKDDGVIEAIITGVYSAAPRTKESPGE